MSRCLYPYREIEEAAQRAALRGFVHLIHSVLVAVTLPHPQRYHQQVAFSTAVREPFRLTRRMVLRTLAWLGALLLFSALGLLVFIARQQRQANEELMAADPVAANYSALEYAIYDCIEQLGHSPADKDELLAMGVLDLPKKKLLLNQDLVNPYTGAPVRFVKPGQPFQDGDCIYLPAFLYTTVNYVEQPPRMQAFYLLVFGPPTERSPGTMGVDFNLDGQPDEFVYAAGEGFIDRKMSAGAHRGAESLHDVLIRLGLEQYWIGKPEQAD